MSGGGLRAQLARGTSVAFGVQIGAVLLGFLLHLVFARTLDLEAYGIYTYAFSWATVLSFLGRLGLTNSIVRFTADYVSHEAWAPLRGLINLARTRVFLASVLITVMAAVVTWHTSKGSASVFYLSFFLIPLLSLASIKDGLLRGLKQPGLSTAIDGLVRPAVTLLCFVGALAFGIAGSKEGAMLATIAGAFAALGLASIWQRRVLPPAVLTATPDRSRSREWTSVSFALLLMGSMSLIHNRADTIMLGWLSGPEEVALYAVASRYAVILLLPLQAVGAIAAPMIAESYARSDQNSLKRIANASGLLIFVLTLPASIAFILFGDSMLAIFGPQFELGYSSLVLLILGQTFGALCGCVAFFMTMTSHQYAAALFNGSTAALNLALNWVLIPRYGSSGAAMATATAIVVQHVFMLIFVVRRLRIDPTFVSALWGWLTLRRS